VRLQSNLWRRRSASTVAARGSDHSPARITTPESASLSELTSLAPQKASRAVAASKSGLGYVVRHASGWKVAASVAARRIGHERVEEVAAPRVGIVDPGRDDAQTTELATVLVRHDVVGIVGAATERSGRTARAP
jgi:hypothetical protein